MLQAHTIELIKATAPVLKKHGTTISKNFYERMFTEHPELLNIFNHANQKRGRQPEALANMVYNAALHIDRLEEVLPQVMVAAQKHRSLGVKPEQYPIVGKYLLLAIKEALQEDATPEIMEAWEEAYGVIAGVFIQVEQELYQQAETQTGGWEGFKPFTVEKKVSESETTTSFYLRPVDGAELATFQPGQYISVKMEIPGQKNTHIRQYSLSDAPGRKYYRITVKKEGETEQTPAGQVSHYLHEQVGEGDTLLLSAPAGEFVLNMEIEKPVVLISGGVGLTPMMAMLNTVIEKQPHRQVTFIHATQNGQSHVFRKEVKELADEHSQVSSFTWYEVPVGDDEWEHCQFVGRVKEEQLRSIWPGREVEVYFCGPVPFMKAIYRMLLQMGVKEEHLHYEFFGPAGILLEEEESVHTS
ncbi:NO-inducible flavohemoprotein [Mechercharimyces sp. CAU 1602]|uniref:NO-inducible flavohemoprotein n=1 Tax=Mechercharimyces sp. CAU 1602 TaxID=2973933 RepID=UPI0021633ACF|nr:NO-inducible flavohemoprotein [Mechercharimyces sp. CAU 1602]MCS1351919.1 NO-inducible flavohemoprotein [Mechercharimyces sp. CAU 1602]